MSQAPVTQIAWQSAQQPELGAPPTAAEHPGEDLSFESTEAGVQELGGDSGNAALLSLCGAGKLLRWELPAGYA